MLEPRYRVHRMSLCTDGQQWLPTWQVLEGVPGDAASQEAGRAAISDIQEGLRRLLAVIAMQDPGKVSFRSHPTHALSALSCGLRWVALWMLCALNHC